MDNFDIYISNIVSKKIYEPPKYKNTIEKTLKEYTNNKCSIINYILKTIAIIVTSISLIGGCAYAIKILCNINLNSNEQKNNDSSTKNSDYVQILNMDYQTVDDLSIKINSILLDDFKLELNIDYLYKKPITSTDSKMIVKDEKGNILYKNDIVIDNASQAVDRNTFIKNNKISYGIIYNQDTVEEKEKIKISNVDCKSCYENISSNNVKRVVNLYAYINKEKFPNSKKIYVQLKDVILKNNGNKVKEIKGDWNFEININEKLC